MSANIPEILSNARLDLGGNVPGQFSPEDWKLILQRAQGRLESGESWPDVIRSFTRERYWGFVPNYKPAKVKAKPNLGVSFVLMTMCSFIFIKIAVVWLGQIYTASENPADGWLFAFAIAIGLGNFGFFLWRHRHHSDEEHDRLGRM